MAEIDPANHVLACAIQWQNELRNLSVTSKGARK